MEAFSFLFNFTFYYPLFMAYVWMLGAIYYYFYWERKGTITELPTLSQYPPVSILIPCHNEGDNARETIHYAMQQLYPNFEVIAINDGSTDNTAEILDQLAKQYDKLRVVHLATNQGKAMGLCMATLASSCEYLICIDGDALLDSHATHWMMKHFVDNPSVGAVTGNPRIRNRSSILGKLQVGEFSSIIGLIKRAQRFYGRIFTVSGAIVGFRKVALQRIGYWSLDMITEDIDVSWRLQLDHWELHYEPRALCWILMPETLKGLWRQRLRWSQGGTEVLIRYFNRLFDLKSWRMWPLYFEYLISIFWAYSMVFTVVILLINIFISNMSDSLNQPILISGWSTMLLGVTCLLQFLISLVIDGRYEKGLGKYYYWIIWYPIAYWLVNVATCVIATPKAFLKKRGKRATWVSPDRGRKI